jgi:hypothetical protein
MVHGVFDPQYQGYGEKFLVRSYLKGECVFYSNDNDYITSSNTQ